MSSEADTVQVHAEAEETKSIATQETQEE